jgi:hypothetical protein
MDAQTFIVRSDPGLKAPGHQEDAQRFSISGSFLGFNIFSGAKLKLYLRVISKKK